jgi:hypothetical protein
LVPDNKFGDIYMKINCERGELAVFRNLGDLDSLNLDLDALTGDIMFPFQTHIAEIKVKIITSKKV